MLPIPELAAAAVANLAYLSEIASDTAPRRGADRLIGRYTKLKTGLTLRMGSDTLSAFEQRPRTPEAQDALRQTLKKLLTEDPVFRVELNLLVEEVSPWM